MYQALCKTKITAPDFQESSCFVGIYAFQEKKIWTAQLVTIQYGAKFGGKVLDKQCLYFLPKHENWSLVQLVKTRGWGTESLINHHTCCTMVILGRKKGRMLFSPAEGWGHGQNIYLHENISSTKVHLENWTT